MEMPWLNTVVNALQAGADQARQSHAVLLLGPPGTGKRCAAAWLARQRLRLAGPAQPDYPLLVPEHADLRWVNPPEDKHAIGIDQVRGLVAELALTSYEGGSKVAIIEPADAMTHSAANSLLKTLEEPPGDTLIVLVADRVGKLPATIFSRCQRLTVKTPGLEEGLAWVDQVSPGGDAHGALAQAGNAPLAAVAALAHLDEAATMAREFADVAEGRASPLSVAARWAKHEPKFVLDWLTRQVQICARRAVAADSGGTRAAVGDSVLKRIDRRNLFCYLDIINRLRSQPAGSFNVLLTFECLLIDWAGGLQTVTGSET